MNIFRAGVLTILLFYCCESKKVDADKVDADKVDLIDTVNVVSIDEKEVEPESDFLDFWESLKQQNADTALLKSIAHFPYPYASFENMIIGEDSFYLRKNDRNILNHLFDRQKVEVYELSDLGINSFLNDYFENEHGDLKGIYVLESSPEPLGYLAYFKKIENEWKFIGCELLEIAD